MVPGSVILVAGEPGIGKSTLLTQLALQVGEGSTNNPVLYVCGEESPEQVGLRVSRLNMRRTPKPIRQAQGKPKPRTPDILMLPTTDVDEVVEVSQRERPGVIIVDSIQTMTTDDLAGMAGSVGQVRESGNRLIRTAKESGAVIFLVGHVTKEGSVAGPKVLEHMVDVVLTLEGEKTGLWRILRALKNRFGATDEVGVFQMDEGGMADVLNPSGAFLEESQAGQPGSAVVALMEGSRPVLVEIQALTVASNLPVPRRVVHGLPLSKMQLLIAVLQRHARLDLGGRDVYVNVAGGLKVAEPAVDLAVALAVASSFMGKALPKETVVVGEVGLLGEIRRVNYLEKRIKEAKKLGYKRAVSSQDYRFIGQAVRELLGKS
jgi:DNA repair protein RadA/Sms